MRSPNEEKKLLASLVVFRELYNSEKDVYGIIAIFLNDVIRTNGLYSFDLSEVTHQLNISYEFKLPTAVVRTALGRLDFLERQGVRFTVKDIGQILDTVIDDKQQEIASNNDAIVEELHKYIETKKNVILSENDKEKISHSFCSFLLDEQNGNEYIAYITAFILEQENNVEFRKQLDLIREGVILYTGIRYNHDLNDFGDWKNELTIFLETEILFHLAGYNGELYQILANDFLSYVKETNRKAGKKLILLKYFEEVKTEIEKFFSKARRLLEGSEPPNPKITAMTSILNGCKKPSDILDKKSDFYTLLQQSSIEEDKYKKYFDLENYRYNRVNQEIIDSVSDEVEKDVEEHLTYLNYISILRAGLQPKSFEASKVILLSGNSTTIKVAWNQLVREDGEVPLATHLSFITNKLWFKLNKGFGSNLIPRSFNIITKAQMSLSKALSDSVGGKFEELKNQFSKGNLTEEQARARIINLRNSVRKPEDISNDIVKDVLAVITEDSLGQFIQNESHFKLKASEEAQDNIRLKQELAQKSEVEKLYVAAKKEILNNKTIQKSNFELRKVELDGIVSKMYSRIKIAIVVGLLLYYVGTIVVIYRYSWDVFEPISYIISLAPFVLSFAYLFFFEADLNPLAVLQKKRVNLQRKIYLKRSFNETAISTIALEIDELQNDIKLYESTVNQAG
ncbi:MAG: hypothetical protein JKY70_04780 [Mucilaginibacter sp.]|nr:hypothetical protein [Mucilaginibacter sp.]